MKIDPVTGKAYLSEWQRDLDRIHLAGFSYGYVETVDLARCCSLLFMRSSNGFGRFSIYKSYLQLIDLFEKFS